MQYDTPDAPYTETVMLPSPYDATPYYQLPVHAPIPAAIDPYGRPIGIKWVADAYGQFVPMRVDQAPLPMQPMPARDLSSVPLIDPRAQVVLAGGVGAGAAGAGIGWGIGQAFAGIAAFGGVTSLAAIAALLLVVRLSGARTTVTNTTHVQNTNRWFGRSTTSTRQG